MICTTQHVDMLFHFLSSRCLRNSLRIFIFSGVRAVKERQVASATVGEPALKAHALRQQ